MYNPELTNNLRKNNEENQLGSQKSGDFSIPAKYKDLPSDVIEELMGKGSEALLIKNKQDSSPIEKKNKQILDKIKQQEMVREETKTKGYHERYSKLKPEEKPQFVEVQKMASSVFQEIIKNNIPVDDLTPEELFVVNKLKSAFEDFREKYPNQPFDFKLASEIDQKIIENLNYRLSFELLDEIKVSIIRSKQDIKAPQEIPAEKAETPEVEGWPDELKEYFEFAQRETLEDQEFYLDKFQKANEVLGKRNGLTEMESGIPTYVIADIHGRREELVKALADKIPEMGNKTVFELMQDGKLNVVCEGDIVHTEVGANWTPYKFETDSQSKPIIENGQIKLTEYGHKYRQVIDEIKNAKNLNDGQAVLFLNNNPDYSQSSKELFQLMSKIKQELLNKEMVRGLGAEAIVNDLIAKCKNFHVARGNHDDVLAATSKFENETEDTRNWVLNNFNQNFLDEWSKFEKNLPLMVTGDNVIVSHTSGKEALTRQEIEQRTSKAQKTLMWTDNRTNASNPISPEKLMQNEEQLRQNLNRPDAIHFIGHRIVDHGKYREQCGGKLIQICNDSKLTTAFVPISRKFNPDQDIKYI